MHVKKGDSVTVVTGKDKGKTAKVVRAFPDRNLVILEGLNLKNRRVRRRSTKDAGQTVKTAAPIHVSNVKLATKPVKKATKTAKK